MMSLTSQRQVQEVKVVHDMYVDRHCHDEFDTVKLGSLNDGSPWQYITSMHTMFSGFCDSS